MRLKRDLYVARLRHAQYYSKQAWLASDLYVEGEDGRTRGQVLFNQDEQQIDTGWKWAIGQSPTPATDILILAFSNATIPFGTINTPQERISRLEVQQRAAQRLERRSEERTAFHNLGNAYASIGDYLSAIVHYQQALAISDELNEPGSSTFFGLGSVYLAIDQLDQAIESFEKYLTIAKGRELWLTICATYPSIGDLYRNTGNYQQAIKAYDRQIAICRDFFDQFNEIRFLNDQRYVHSQLSDYFNAIECCEQLDKIIVQLNSHQLYDNVDNSHIAIAHFEHYLAIANEQADRIGEANFLSNLGLVYYAAKDYPHSIDSYERCIKIFQELNDVVGVAFNNWNLGQTLQQQGNLGQAIERMQVYVTLLQEVEHPEVTRYNAHLDYFHQQYQIQQGHL